MPWLTSMPLPWYFSLLPLGLLDLERHQVEQEQVDLQLNQVLVFRRSPQLEPAGMDQPVLLAELTQKLADVREVAGNGQVQGLRLQAERRLLVGLRPDPRFERVVVIKPRAKAAPPQPHPPRFAM